MEKLAILFVVGLLLGAGTIGFAQTTTDPFAPSGSRTNAGLTTTSPTTTAVTGLSSATGSSATTIYMGTTTSNVVATTTTSTTTATGTTSAVTLGLRQQVLSLLTQLTLLLAQLRLTDVSM